MVSRPHVACASLHRLHVRAVTVVHSHSDCSNGQSSAKLNPHRVLAKCAPSLYVRCGCRVGTICKGLSKRCNSQLKMERRGARSSVRTVVAHRAKYSSTACVSCCTAATCTRPRSFELWASRRLRTSPTARAPYDAARARRSPGGREPGEQQGFSGLPAPR